MAPKVAQKSLGTEWHRDLHLARRTRGPDADRSRPRPTRRSRSCRHASSTAARTRRQPRCAQGSVPDYARLATPTMAQALGADAPRDAALRFGSRGQLKRRPVERRSGRSGLFAQWRPWFRSGLHFRSTTATPIDDPYLVAGLLQEHGPCQAVRPTCPADEHVHP